MTAIRKLQEAYDAVVPDDSGAMAMDLIRHIAGLYSGKAIKGDFTQIYITGNEIWMAQQVLAQRPPVDHGMDCCREHSCGSQAVSDPQCSHLWSWPG
ncbi:hypothetical protein ACEOQP_19205 [Pseudomonas aeruginosa]